MFIYPGFRFGMRAGREQFVADLVAHFPQEEQAIRRYARDVSRAAQGYSMHVMRRNSSPLLRLFGAVGGRFWRAGC